MNILEIKLNRSKVVQDLAVQTARNRGSGIVLASEQNQNLPDAMRFQDKKEDVIICAWRKEHHDARKLVSGNGFVGIAIKELAIYSCYFSPDAP